MAVAVSSWEEISEALFITTDTFGTHFLGSPRSAASSGRNFVDSTGLSGYARQDSNLQQPSRSILIKDKGAGSNPDVRSIKHPINARKPPD